MTEQVTDPLALAAAAGETLFHTKGGNRLHIRACSHFYPDSELLVTTPTDATTRELCAECEAELTGRGRTVYDDLDRAFEDLPVPLEARARVRELTADIDPERIWIPYSRSYVALGRTDQPTVYIGKTYVWRDDTTIQLPGYTAGRGSGAPRPERAQPVCGTCGYELPATGICDNCA